MSKILFVANVAKEHILKFHIPTIKRLVAQGWTVDIACGGADVVPFCNNQFRLPIDRSPFKTHLFRGICQLKEIIETGDYDIVYCHTSVGSVVAKLASIRARKRGTKVVHFAHGTYFYKDAPLHNWILYYPLFKLLSYLTDATITITEEDYCFTSSHFGHGRTYYVEGIGVDPNRFTIENKDAERARYRSIFQIPQDAFVLIYLAELSPNKNQQWLINVLAQVMKQRENVYLVLPGKDYTNGSLERMAKDQGVQEHVRFMGWRSDVPYLLNMSDICTASSIREGLGLNLIEAMICGLPVIASSNSGHRAVIKDGENGFLVPLNNDSLFVQRIIELIDDQSLRTRIVQSALTDIDKYYTNHILNKLMWIFGDVLNR